MSVNTFLKHVKKVRNEVLDLGADLVPIDTIFLKRRINPIGYCLSYSEPEQFCDLEYSVVVLDFKGSALHEVIAHEILHAIRGSVGHDETFLKYAALMNEKYGLSIGIYSSQEVIRANIENRNYNYVVRCKDCGSFVGYSRMTGLIHDLFLYGESNDYYCPWCDSDHFSLDVDLCAKSSAEILASCARFEKHKNRDKIQEIAV